MASLAPAALPGMTLTGRARVTHRRAREVVMVDDQHVNDLSAWYPRRATERREYLTSIGKTTAF
jgi:hypothetical protein